jgi:hypothetical protein
MRQVTLCDPIVGKQHLVGMRDHHGCSNRRAQT